MVQKKLISGFGVEGGNLVSAQKILKDSGVDRGKDARKVLMKVKSLKNMDENMRQEKKELKKKKKERSEPNYMKSTESSKAKRAQAVGIDVSKAMDDDRRKGNSARKPLMRMKSFGVRVRKPTCSSAIKNTKPLNCSDGDLSIPLCSFSYCSMNSIHSHSSVPSMRRFLSGRRKWAFKNKELKLKEAEFFVDICAPPIKSNDRNSLVVDPIFGVSSMEMDVMNDSLALDDDLERGSDFTVFNEEIIRSFDGLSIKDKSSGFISPPAEQIRPKEEQDDDHDHDVGDDEMHDNHDEAVQPCDGSCIEDKLLDIICSRTRDHACLDMILHEVNDDDTAKVDDLCLHHDEVDLPHHGSTMNDKLHGEERENLVIVPAKPMKENGSTTKETMFGVHPPAESYNPKPPNFLPKKSKIDSEKVFLRHQSMEERLKSEEWMVDYALQRAVEKLAFEQRSKVAPLVRAFETVLPCESSLLHEESKNLPPSMIV